jgi:putative toxin-antitoxin system antitoxin component (TIGR02293 family)
MKRPKAPSRRPASTGKRRPARRSARTASGGEFGFSGFGSPASAYDYGAAVLVEAIPAEGRPQAAAVRATPPALRSLEERGYSQDEIFALVVPRRTYARRVKRGELLTVEETDRAFRLARVAELAERIFGDKAKAHRWLRKPKRTLSRATPLTYLASEAGARLVEDMLYRIDSGFFA